MWHFWLGVGTGIWCAVMVGLIGATIGISSRHPVPERRPVYGQFRERRTVGTSRQVDEPSERLGLPSGAVGAPREPRRDPRGDSMVVGGGSRDRR